jgi:hypothetical protein
VLGTQEASGTDGLFELEDEPRPWVYLSSICDTMPSEYEFRRTLANKRKRKPGELESSEVDTLSFCNYPARMEVSSAHSLILQQWLFYCNSADLLQFELLQGCKKRKLVTAEIETIKTISKGRGEYSCNHKRYDVVVQ